MIGVEDEAELHVLVAMYVVELWRPSLFSILIDGVFREICRASRGQSGPAAFSSASRPPTCISVASYSEKVDNGACLHACDIVYRWQPKSGQLDANYCHRGA